MKTPVELAREALQDPGAVVCFVLRVPLRSRFRRRCAS